MCCSSTCIHNTCHLRKKTKENSKVAIIVLSIFPLALQMAKKIRREPNHQWKLSSYCKWTIQPWNIFLSVLVLHLIKHILYCCHDLSGLRWTVYYDPLPLPFSFPPLLSSPFFFPSPNSYHFPLASSFLNFSPYFPAAPLQDMGHTSPSALKWWWETRSAQCWADCRPDWLTDWLTGWLAV